MTLASTRVTRWLSLLVIVPLTLTPGCGQSSGDPGATPVQTAASVSATAKENYLKSRAERKAQNPSGSRTGASRGYGNH